MFDQPRPSLNVRALIRDMIEDERELITTLGQDFLTEHLNDVETRLHRWQVYLENHYAGATPPRGDADRLRAYQVERALITRLADNAQTEPFPAVHQHALKHTRQRVRRLVDHRNVAKASLRTALFEARLEQELLLELWSKWHSWLRPRPQQTR